MKFHVQHDVARERVILRCEVGPDPERPGNRLFAYGRSNGLHSVGYGEEAPIWDWFPEQAVTPMIEALAPKPDVSARHLEDALGVRDRLLTLVEAMTAAPHHEHVEQEALIRCQSGGPL